MVSLATYARTLDVHPSTALRWLHEALGAELERGESLVLDAAQRGRLPGVLEVLRLPGGHFRLRVEKKTLQTASNGSERA